MLVALVCVLPLGAAALSPYEGLSRLPRQPGFFTSVAVPQMKKPASKGTWCQPEQACWPTSSEWAAFNTTLNGALIEVAPPLAPCFGFNGVGPNGAVCSSVVNNFSNSYFRASLPGAQQNINWEQDQTTGKILFA